MDYNNLQKIVMQKQKGSFSGIVWEKSLPVKKIFSDLHITKKTQTVARFGVSYDNMQAIQSKRKSGELPKENAGLTWGEWEEFPYFIKHKDKKYLRISLDKNNKMQTEYFLNGQPVSKEQIKQYCLASAFKENESKPDVLTICVDNILSVK